MKEKIVGFKKGDSNVDKFKMMEFKKGGGRKKTVEYKCKLQGDNGDWSHIQYITTDLQKE